MRATYKPGHKVPRSGIYQVMHSQAHTDEHEIIALFSERFPHCHWCGDQVRFRLLRAVHHIGAHEYFRSGAATILIQGA